MSVGATARLSRLLSMVPWLLDRQGVPMADAARQFGITEDELVRDLELLFVCGTPGHLPDDLIEADWSSGQVYLGNADEISRPLRLSADEAVALLAGLRTLAAVPGLHDRAAVESALNKLSAAASDAVPLAEAVQIDLSSGIQEATLTAARDALARHRRLRIRYLVPRRDETTERDVDPMRVLSTGGRWYLEAWCHRAEDVRMFRIDRMVGIEVLDEDGTPPPQAVSRDIDETLFAPDADDVVVTLDVDPSARWVSEYYPAEVAERRPDGTTRLLLHTADPSWVVRLVLRLGGSARVVEPSYLQAEVERAAGAALAAYSGL